MEVSIQNSPTGQAVGQVVRDVFTSAREDQDFIDLMNDPTEKTLHKVKENLKSKYLPHSGSFHPEGQEIFMKSLMEFGKNLKVNHEDWHHVVAMSGKTGKGASFEESALPKLNMMKQGFMDDMRAAEEKKILELVAQDEASGTLDHDQAEDARKLAKNGRLMLYSVSEEYDGYISHDEFEQTKADPASGEAKINVFNPLWSNGKKEVKLKEVGKCLDVKETVEVVTKLEASGMQMDEVVFDESTRTVEGSIQGEQGKFRFKVTLDDGTHEPLTYELIDENGAITTLNADQIEDFQGVQGLDMIAIKEKAEQVSRKAHSGMVMGSGGVPQGRLQKLGNSLGLNLAPKIEAPGRMSKELEQLVQAPPRTSAGARIVAPKPKVPKIEMGSLSAPSPTGPPSGGAPGGGPAGTPKVPQGAKISVNKPTAKAAGPSKEEADQQNAAMAAQAAQAQQIAQAQAQQAQQAPERFTGLPGAPQKKKGWKKIAAVAGVSGGSALGVPTFGGIFSVFTEEDAAEPLTFIIDITQSLFTLIA
jgi:hypothetical protein